MSTHADTIRAILAAGNVVLGPMAGITEAPFRAICKRMGAGLTYTEMVSTKGLHYRQIWQPTVSISCELLVRRCLRRHWDRYNVQIPCSHRVE